MIKIISGHIHIGVEMSFPIHTKVAVQILRLHLNWDGGSISLDLFLSKKMYVCMYVTHMCIRSPQ